MAMILRLQGEKAALAMEARQYRRVVEERMSHAELSLELLEDLNYRREAEIKNLECELHACRCKLLSLGCSGVDVDDMRCCDRSQTPSPEPSDADLPAPVEKGVIEQSLDSSRREHQEKKSLDFYWDQIKKLDEQLKELTGFRDSLRMETKDETLSASSSNTRGIVQKEKAKCLWKPDLLVRKMCKRSSKQKRDRSVKRDDNVRGSSYANDAEYQAELQRLKERVERLERERCNTKPQEEMMTVQRKPKEELSSAQSVMKISRTTRNDDSAIASLQEAMLYFWL